MRSWSHHHSTDTVDDPVFRAAMRGCDAVSFVFGLEVTWSLIQQRRQEEEEAAAAKVLEEMDANGQLCCGGGGNDGDDSDDDDDDDDDAKPAATESAGNQESDCEKEIVGTKPTAMESDEEDSDSEEENVDAKPAATEPDEDESDSDEEIDKTANASVLKQSSVVLSEDSEDSSEEDEDESVAITQQADRPGDVAGSGRRNQATFTLEDTSDEEESPAKEKRSPLSKKEVVDSLASTPKPRSPKNVWACVACTLHNKLSNRTCEMCGADRPNRRSK